MTRRYLSANELRDMLERQHGLCAAEGCMSEGPFEADHSTPHVWDDKKPDQLLCIACHKAKTKRDVKAIAKAKRLNGTTSSQASRREKFGPKLKSNAKLQSRGFDKSLSKKMTGEVVRRDR